MNIADMIKNAADQIIEPDTGALARVRDFSSMREHLQEAENDYAEAVKTFEDTNPGSRYIIDIASQANKSGEVLISRALTLYTHYQATREDKELANQIIDRITKDASIREKTCSQYYRFMKEANPNARELIAAILKEKQKIMHFLDRCIRTQSVYLRKFEKGELNGNATAFRKAVISARRCHSHRKESPGIRMFPIYRVHTALLWILSRKRKCLMSNIRILNSRRIT